MLGETRELRKVFFEQISVKPVGDETWYKSILQQILDKMNKGLPIATLQDEVDEKLSELYDLTEDERSLIQ